MVGRRLALSVPLALALLAGASGAAVADEPIVATIGQSTVPDTTTLGSLQATCTTANATYAGPTLEQYGPGGTLEPETSITPAWTLAGVLGCLAQPVPMPTVTGVTVVGPNGPEATLSAADLATPSDFANPQESPLIGSDGEGIEYERPWRGSGDDNAADAFQLTGSQPLQLEVLTGPLLTVTVTAPATASPGSPVALAATVIGAPAGAAYSWDFDGGTGTAASPDPSVTFTSAGVYTVTLEVTDAAGGGGVATATITVGAPTPTTSTGPPTGPTTATGTAPGATPSPTKPSGAAGRRHTVKHHQRRPKRPAPTVTVTTATSPSTPPGTTTGTASGTSTGTVSTPATTTAAAATTAPATTPSVATAPARRRRRATPPTRRRVRRSSPRASTSASPRAALVTGRLVGDVIPVPAADSPLTRPVLAAATPPALRRVSGSSVLPGLGAGLAVVALLLLGAARELRWRRLGSPAP